MFEKQRDTMWITVFLVALICLSHTQATDNCDNVPYNCKQASQQNWIKCIENRLTTCNCDCDLQPGKQSRLFTTFLRGVVNSSQQADVKPSLSHRVQIPSSALQRSRGNVLKEEVMLVATVINSSLFTASPPRARRVVGVPTYKEGTVMGGLVLVVRAGDIPVQNLPHPIKLTFRNNKQEGNGTCVFWHETWNGSGYWSPDGCDTNNTGTEFVCSCNHLSFFAVLVNPEVSVDKSNAVALSYITYVGSGLCVLFTVISLIVFICLQRQRPEKAIGVHMHLTGALFCLHLSFLLCCFWVWLLKEEEEGLVCQGLGLFLHWSLLATFCWMALEGFHLYLLLVRVFNIYIRRYLLKLSLVGWGLPTVTVVICEILGVYGKYSLELESDNNHNSTAQICWMSSKFSQRPLVSYITTLAFPSLVILCNSLMLGLVVYKMWKLRRGCGGINSTGCWKKMNKEKVSRLWKDCATVLGLSCVLGLTWGLASATYISIPGIYVFTILNSLQGVFMFLWSLALTCKSRSDYKSSVRDSSSQKMMTTSFNN